MPLYEFYCEHCNGVFESFRQMRDASLPAPCPQCSRDAQRIMSNFNAFTFRDGYPRRIPDKGTYWHMGKEVKRRAKRMRGYEHPELAKPKPKPRPTKGEREAEEERKRALAAEIAYKERWGIDKYGFRTVKTKGPEVERTIITPEGKKTTTKRELR